MDPKTETAFLSWCMMKSLSEQFNQSSGISHMHFPTYTLHTTLYPALRKSQQLGSLGTVPIRVSDHRRLPTLQVNG